MKGGEMRNKNARWKIENNALHRLLSARKGKYIPEVKAVVIRLYNHDYKTHIISRGWKLTGNHGLSTKTISNWIKKVKIHSPINSVRRRIKNTWASVSHVKIIFENLVRWLRFRDKGGYLDLDACLRGERPP